MTPRGAAHSWMAVVLAGVTVAASVPAARAAGPALSARNAVLTVQSTGQRLYGHSPDARVPIASATKLMTALLTLEHVRHLSRMFSQNDYYAAAVDSQIGLVPGERMSVHDLLLALMLPSADDAAEDLAYNIGGHSVARFVGMMNQRARRLGLSHTHYSTPIGLDTAGNYSSASDLATLASYLLTHSRFFARIVALPRAVLATGNHVRVIINRNDLVGRYRWINGVKTGHTHAAGYVLVGSGTRRGMTLISVVLGTPSEANRDGDTLALQKYGFSAFRLVSPVRAGEVLARPAVKDRPGDHVPVVAASSLTRVIPRAAVVHLRVQVPAAIGGPQRRNQVVGSVSVFAGRRLLARIRLLLAHAVPAVGPLTVAARFLTRGTTLLWLLALIGAIFTVAVVWRGKARGRDPAGSQAA